VTRRAGQPVDVELNLELAKHSNGYLVPRMLYEVTPSYFVYGGLVFAPLTVNYIVLRHEDVDRRNQVILARYSVPADRSPDLMAMKSSLAIEPPADVTAEANTNEHPAIPTSAATQ